MVKPREVKSYKIYTSLVKEHKELYEKATKRKDYNQRYWIYNDVSWRDLDSYTRSVVLEGMEEKVARGEF